jgi:diguanylate cyclase (GGDEF)-like protein
MTVAAPTAGELADEAWRLASGDPRGALVLAKAALEQAVTEDDPAARARALRAQGRCEQQLGLLVDAATTLQEAAAAAAASGQLKVRLESLNGLSHVFRQLADVASSVEVLQEALALARTQPDPRLAAGVLVNLSGARLDLGDAPGALEQARALLALDVDDVPLRVCAHGQLARALAALGEHEASAAEHAVAQRLAEGIGDDELFMSSALGLAGVLVTLGRHRAAQEQAELALRLAHRVAGPFDQCEVYVVLGRALLGQGRAGAALDAMRHAVAHAEDAAVARLAASAAEGLAAALHALGDDAGAYEALGRALESTRLAEREETDGRAQAALARHRAAQAAAEADRLARENAALEHARQAAEELTRVDPLTGSASRRRGGEELARLMAGDAPFGVVVADVDHFKQVNDTLGHAAGDEVLVEVARRLREAVRDGDVVARWGGEEFLVLLPLVTDDDVLLQTAERLRAAVGGLPVPTAGGDRRVTASFGACLRVPDVDALRAADDALYAAKRGGRDRVVLAGPATPR